MGQSTSAVVLFAQQSTALEHMLTERSEGARTSPELHRRMSDAVQFASRRYYKALKGGLEDFLVLYFESFEAPGNCLAPMRLAQCLL